MICFYRDFEYINIVIKIEDIIYLKHRDTFSSLFFTYSNYNKSKSNNVKTIYIYGPEIPIADSDIKKNCDYYHLCDFESDNWLNTLTNFLEYCYEKILVCTMFHGSCLILDNKGIMLLGKSKSGKSTLAYHLIHHHDASYLDDDVVYLLNGEFIGFNTPMRLRENYNNQKLLEIEHYIDDVTRYTIDIEDNRKISKIANIHYIIFPKYEIDIDFQVSEICGYALINKIISNIKGTTNMITTYKDISKYFSDSKAYEIKYNNFCKIPEFLKDIFLR